MEARGKNIVVVRYSEILEGALSLRVDKVRGNGRVLLFFFFFVSFIRCPSADERRKIK